MVSRGLRNCEANARYLLLGERRLIKGVKKRWAKVRKQAKKVAG